MYTVRLVGADYDNHSTSCGANYDSHSTSCGGIVMIVTVLLFGADSYDSHIISNGVDSYDSHSTSCGGR